MVSIIIAILVFSFLIITHELGHFFFARKCGIGVEEFSVGMGPRILSKEVGETRYSLKLIPFGGSCAMVGEDEENPAENAFNNKPVLSRILVVIGGPMFNLICAFILSVIVILMNGANPAEVYKVYEGYGAAQAGIQEGDVITKINNTSIHVGREIALFQQVSPLDGSDVTVTFRRNGETQTVTYDPHYTTYRLGISYMADENEAVLSDVSEGTPAAEAGLMKGDVIREIDGTAITNGAQVQQYFLDNPPDGSPVQLVVERAGETLQIPITPVFFEGNILGFEASYASEKVSVPGAVVWGFKDVCFWIRYTFASLRMLVTGKVGVNQLSGPVGIVSQISTEVNESSSQGIGAVVSYLLNMAILLSANLGVLNLLPIPALDGGRLLFLLIEAVRRKPLPQDKEGMVHMAGFALLMVLMVFIMFNDILKLVGR